MQAGLFRLKGMNFAHERVKFTTFNLRRQYIRKNCEMQAWKMHNFWWGGQPSCRKMLNPIFMHWLWIFMYYTRIYPDAAPERGKVPPLRQGVSEKSKVSSISTNAAGFCVKKPWAIPHNSKCRYDERGAADAKPKAQIILCVLSSILATQMLCRSRRSGA